MKKAMIGKKRTSLREENTKIHTKQLSTRTNKLENEVTCYNHEKKNALDKNIEIYNEKKQKTFKLNIFFTINKKYLFISFISTVLLLFQLCFIDNSLLNCFSYILFYIINTVIIYVSCETEILNIKFLFFALFSLFIGVSPIAYYYIDKVLFIDQLQLISLSILMYTIGINIRINQTNNKNLNKIKLNNKKTLIISYVFVVIGIIATLIYLIENFNLLFGGNLESGRVTALSGNGIILQLMNLGVIGVYLLFDKVLEKRYSIKKFIPITIIVLLCMLIKGFRTAVIGPLLVIILMYNKKKKIKQKNVVALIAIMFVAFIGLGVMRNVMSNGEGNVFNTIIYTLRNGSDNLNRIIYAFGNKYKFQYGYTYWINIKMMLPGPDKDFTLWLKDILQMSFQGGGVSPSIIGEFYMNFNSIGVYIGMLLMGIIGNIISNLYKNSNLNSYISFLAYIYVMTNSGGIANVEINLLITTTVYIGVILMCKENVIKNKKKEGVNTQ